MFVADRLEAVKWRNWKIVFYDEQRDWWSPPVKLGTPKAFDLITDPKEEYPATGLRNTWNAGSGHQDRDGVRAKPEEISADRAGHARPLHAAEVTTTRGSAAEP